MIEALKKQIEEFIQYKVPMMGYAGVTIVAADDQHCIVKIPLKAETKNHLNSMYFGALAVGADGAGGLIALYQIFQSGKNISLVFKDFTAKFLKRPEADVCFTCRDGEAIRDVIQQTIRTGERVNLPVRVIATTPDISGDEPVAEFTLTLSLK